MLTTNKDGTKAISAKDKAKTVNDYFTSVFTTENLPAVKNAPTHEVLSNIEITPDEVECPQSEQKSWSGQMASIFPETICTPLSILFTKSEREPMNLGTKPLLRQLTKME